MEYFLGTPERAQGFIVNMKDFAATTAFSTQQALDLSRRLMAAQFKPEEVRSIMEILNDAASATGATSDQIDRIVLALTQIRTNGKLAGQEIRQLAEANIPIYTILQEQLGLTGEQLMNIGDLKVPGDLAVTAVLKGLQQRYEGAAQRIADTVPGMIETIKDDMLILGEAIFQAPYKSLENFLRTLRDTLEEARDILTESGLGGVVEEMFSPEIQQPIRVIVGSAASLAKSFVMIQKALAPVIAELGKSFIQILSAVMPVIASVVRVISTLAYVALNTVAPLRWLAAALIGLLVARSAAASLMFLWKVMRLGVVAAAVAKAVNLLTGAIRALFLTLARNPMTAVVLVISAVLLHLALSSKTVTKWLDQLTARLSSLAGFNVDDILQSEIKDLNEWAAEFNESVSGIDDNLRDVAKDVIKVGEDAKKSGKKVKDKFVAAFDEVFQVPEEKDLDKLLDGMEDLEDIKVPDFIIDLPKLDELDLSGLDDEFDLEWPEFRWPEFVWPEFRWPEYPPWHWPPFALEFVWPPLPEFSWPPLPKWEWPPFPKWEWPTLPEWEWQPIPIPAWDPIPLPEWEWPT
ncbi:MAG: tape measure protein, partial [Bacteroidales bacterium]|nr:tape measure protein [Bacteroidales bacterium]